VHGQHLRRLTLGTVQARQVVLLDFADVGLKYLAKVVHQAHVPLSAPKGHCAVLFELHPQAVRELASHHRLANPGDRLEHRARGLEVEREKRALQVRNHVGAQGDGVVMPDVTRHRYTGNGKQRQARRPHQCRAQRQQQQRGQQQRRHRVHQANVEWQGSGQGSRLHVRVVSRLACCRIRRHSSA